MSDCGPRPARSRALDPPEPLSGAPRDLPNPDRSRLHGDRPELEPIQPDWAYSQYGMKLAHSSGFKRSGLPSRVTGSSSASVSEGRAPLAPHSRRPGPDYRGQNAQLIAERKRCDFLEQAQRADDSARIAHAAPPCSRSRWRMIRRLQSAAGVFSGLPSSLAIPGSGERERLARRHANSS